MISTSSAYKIEIPAAQISRRLGGKDFLAILALLILGAGLRWLAIPSQPVLETDACVYLATGKNLVEGKGLTCIDGGPDLVNPPLFPLAAGLLYLAIGNLEYAGILTTLVFGSLIIAATWWLGWTLFRERRIAWGAALVVALHPRMVGLSVESSSEALYIFVLLASIGVFVSALRSSKVILYALAGALLGTTYLTRAVGFFYLPVFCFATLMYLRFNLKERSLWLGLAALIAGFLLVSFPYLNFIRAQTGYWSLCPKFTPWWGAILGDMETLVYGRGQAGMGKPEYSNIWSLWLHRPDQLAKVLMINFQSALVERFGVPFPPWIFAPALLGLICARGSDARKNLFLLAMFLPLGVQFVSNFTFRYFFPLIPIVALWIPGGVEIFSAWCQKSLMPKTPRAEKAVRMAVWAALAFLMVLPTLAHAKSSADLPLEHKAAGLWLKEHGEGGKVIMSRKPWVSFYSGGKWNAIPHASVEEILASAKSLGVEFLVIDERMILEKRPQLAYLLADDAVLPGYRRVYQGSSPKKIILYQVVP